MIELDQLQFTIAELASLLGLAQCLYVIIYILFHSGDFKRAFTPFLYFTVLGFAFFLDFAQRFLGETIDIYYTLQWFMWFSGPPLSVLLIVQIAQIRKMPSLINFSVVLLPFAALFSARFLASIDSECEIVTGCPVYKDWLVITGLCAGALSLLGIWVNRSVMHGLQSQKYAKNDRYWLILTLVFINLSFLGLMLISVSAVLDNSDTQMIRTVLGLGFVYLASTSLFRIYPQALKIVEPQKPEMMSADDKILAQKIKALLDHDKIYHEASYSRTDMARELGVPDGTISRVISAHFNKTFPQLLNERRVEDAKRLLVQTDAPVAIIAEDVGFSAISSFNRVFKDIVGITAGQYRKKPV